MASSRQPPSSTSIQEFGRMRPGDGPGGSEATSFTTAGARHIDTSPHRLALIVEQEIVPRLMLLHREPATAKRKAGRRRNFGARKIKEFTSRLLIDDAEEVATIITTEIERGTSPGSVCLDLLAPTAKRLGELWEADAIDFVQVTLALTRLHTLLKALQTPPLVEPGEGARHVLLAPMPGDTHAFGLAIVAEFFRASGWIVTGGTLAEVPDLVGEVERSHYSLVGISLGSEVLRPALIELIASIRRRSLNASVAVVVGGPLFTLNPDWVGEVGADGTAGDAKEAVKLGERLLARQRSAARYSV